MVKPETSRELVDALDAEYVRRLKGWSLEQLLEAEDQLLEQYRELATALPKPGKGTEDPETYHQWARIRDELRAVMVARVARGAPFRDELPTQAKEDV